MRIYFVNAGILLKAGIVVRLEAHMNVGSVYVTPAFDCLGVPRQANVVRFAIARHSKTGESTVSARLFKGLDGVQEELARVDLLSRADSNDLQQNLCNGLSWESANLISFTDEQLMKLKLQPIRWPALTPACH
jgi:hypothetical protein